MVLAGLGAGPGRTLGLGVCESLAPGCSVGRPRVKAMVSSGCLAWPSPPSSHGHGRMHSQTHANAGLKCDISRPNQKEQAHTIATQAHTRAGQRAPCTHRLPHTHSPEAPLHCPASRPPHRGADMGTQAHTCSQRRTDPHTRTPGGGQGQTHPDAG